MKPIATFTRTQQLLSSNNLRAKKHLGQNFLVDVQIIEKIIRSSLLTPQDGVIEIGPGIGGLTQQLLLHAKEVVCFEIDYKLEPILKEQLGDNQHFHLIMQDFMKVDVNEIIKDYFQTCENILVIANLPYYITTAILIKLFESQSDIKSMTVMMQKEVAHRFNAKVGSKQYNSLTILTQYFADVHYEFTVPTTVFIPQPKVESSIVRFEFRKYPVAVEDEQVFFELLRTSFRFRRKTLYNNLKPYFLDLDHATTVLAKVNATPVQRAETLTIDQFIGLANLISKEHINDL